jgi:hypothetical protein
MDHKQTTPGKRNYSGLDLEKNISPSGRGKAFFLTFLFIELIGLVVSRSSPDCYNENHPLLVIHRTPKTSDVERLLAERRTCGNTRFEGAVLSV